MKLSPRQFEAALGIPFFNFSVDSARAEDYLAIYRWVRQQGVHLKYLIIGLDIEALDNNDVPDARLVANDVLQHELSGTGAIPSSSREAELRAAICRYKSTYALSYLSDVCRSVRVSLQPAERRLPAGEFEPDGYLRYRKWERERARGTFSADREITASLPEYLRRFSDMTALSPRRQAYLEEVIKEAQQDGTRVTVWLTSIHPRASRLLSEKTEYHRLLLRTRSYLQRLGASYHVDISDCSDPALYGGTLSGWYDCGHIDESNATLVTARLVEQSRHHGF
jgi:hypothetical protein